MDCITKEQRSAIMRAVKSKDTKIEVIFRKSLWKNGIRYRKNYKVCNCRPDIVITKYKIAIFCDGDFWHGNNNKKQVQTNIKYWTEKIKRNQERDLENTITLRDAEWTVLRFWENDLNKNLNICIDVIKHYIAIKKQKITFNKIHTGI